MTNSMLLHICCAPCSTSAIEVLSEKYKDITAFYYNPNITPFSEVELRYDDALEYYKKRYNGEIKLIKGEYDNENWHSLISPLESTGEKGMRCWLCYYLRLKKTFEKAKELNIDNVATTLSTSIYKNIDWIESIGKTLSDHYGINFVNKAWGYRRSIEISKEYGLYRQNYCGCCFSLKEREEKIRNRKLKIKNKKGIK